jgi:nicotinic acid mononucleotide adenylyltransferase
MSGFDTSVYNEGVPTADPNAAGVPTADPNAAGVPTTPAAAVVPTTGADTGKRIAFLFPGSFSPITNAHKQSIIKLIKYGIVELKAGYVTVYIIPASNQYKKIDDGGVSSIYFDLKKNEPLSAEYLSEDKRLEFINYAINLINNVPELLSFHGRFNVVFSDIDYRYGHGYYDVDNSKESSGLMPTSFLAFNYDKSVKIIEGGYVPLLAGFNSNETYLILGADNAYTDIVGWRDPLTILISIQVLVITRGTPGPNRDREITLWYEGAPPSRKLKYNDALAARNLEYSQLLKMEINEKTKEKVEQILKTTNLENFNLEKLMEKRYKVLPFEIPEISSTILRKIVIGNDINESEIAKLKTIVETINNGEPVPVVVKIDQVNSVDIGIKESIVSILSPISYEKLKDAYENNGYSKPKPEPVVAGAKTRRRKSRKTKKRRSLRKRNRVHKKR